MSVVAGMSAVVVLVVVGVCLLHVVLSVVALVMLARTPAAQLRMAKWVWALVIVFGHTVGPIAFLVFGRQPAENWAPMPADRHLAEPERF